MFSDAHFSSIRAFVEAAETHSFTLAAERLDLSRSAVGKAVARLERRLGTRLFHRSTRQLTLTEEGRDYLAHCLRAMAELEAAEARLAARNAQPAGRIHIALPVLFGRRWVVPILSQLAFAHPALAFDLQFASSRSDLKHEGIDLAVRIGDIQHEADLVARPLGMQHTVLCAAPGYLAPRVPPGQAGDLADHVCITEGTGSVAWRMTDPQGQLHTVQTRGRWRGNHTGALLDLALAGQGIALLPVWMLAEHLHSGALQMVLPGWYGPALPIHLVWPHGGPLPLRVRCVVDALLAAFLDHSPWQEAGTLQHTG